MSRQACPACDRHWTPPGPCTHWDGDGECGYREPERTHAAVPTPARPPIPSDGYTLGKTVDPLEGLRRARQELEKAKQAKGAA